MQYQNPPTDSEHEPPARTDIEPLPDGLDSAQAKLVYLTLQATEHATAADLQATLSMKKLSVLTVLRSLSTDGLVEREGDRYVVA